MPDTSEQDLPEYSRMLLGIRKQRGWTQEELAHALSVHERTIRRWESAEQAPHPMWLPAIRQLLQEVSG